MPGDTFMLCSDGLSGQVDDEEIGVLMGCLTPQEAVQQPVDLANLAAAPSNITVIVARVMDLSRVQNATPPKMPKSGDGSDAVSPFVWADMGVAAVLGAALVVTEKYVPGFAAVAVSVLLGLYAFAKGTSGRSVRAWRGGGWARAAYVDGISR